MAHAAWIAFDLQNGELICPVVVITRGEMREVIPFEAQSQIEAIERGKASLEELKDSVDCWALTREGLFSTVNGDSGKRDVLAVSSWVRELDEPIILQQLFVPKAKGTFWLVGKLMITVHGQIPEESIQEGFRKIAMEGVAQHPHWRDGDYWVRGLRMVHP